MMMQRLLQKDVHVVPTSDGEWSVEQYNAFQGLWRDFRRFSLKIALHNFCCILFDIMPAAQDD